jgi:hypothetical protein
MAELLHSPPLPKRLFTKSYLTFKIATKTSPGSNVTLPKKPDNAANKPESTEKAKVVRIERLTRRKVTEAPQKT